MASLCSSSHLYRSIDLSDLTDLSSIPPSFLAPVRHLALRGAHLSLDTLIRFFTKSQLEQLTSLDLSFTANANEFLFDALPASLRMRLRSLKLRGCRGVRDGVWVAELLPNLEVLDASWSGLRTLPGGEWKTEELEGASMDVDEASWIGSDDTLVDEAAAVFTPWSKLRRLDVSACGALTGESLAVFLVDHLPPMLSHLNLSCLGAYSLDIVALHRLHLAPGQQLKLDLRRCDGVTLEDVGVLRRYGIEVVHTALLENDTPAGYRRFLELVTQSQSL